MENASAFTSIRFLRGESEPLERVTGGVRGLGPQEPVFASDEDAARHYLEQVLTQGGIRALDATGANESTDVRLRDAASSVNTKTTLMRFVQTKNAIPIFDSHAAVELDDNRTLVALDADLATSFGGVSTVPKLESKDALACVADFVKVDPSVVGDDSRAELMLYRDENKGSWHLVWHFPDVPAAPAGTEPVDERAFGISRFLQEELHCRHYLVDAADGKVVLHYSSSPGLVTSAPLVATTNDDIGAIPVECNGRDGHGKPQKFYGMQTENGFALRDPLGHVVTYDATKGDVLRQGINLITEPLANSAADFGTVNPAAISAHVNAARVQDFFRNVLKRQGIDNKGMELVSVVNCTCAKHQPPPAWKNACFHNDCMWYGQWEKSPNEWESLAVYLDIIAHELTHGITRKTSNLKYLNESGALNEAMSDIFGIIVANWEKPGPDHVDQWKFEMGAGLGKEGGPMRDISNPAKYGYPAHMTDYVFKNWDNGGVHTNCSIPCKAAHNILVAKDDQGYVFNPGQVAVLYYECLLRLPATATFKNALQKLVDVATIMYSGNVTARDRKVACIIKAHADVGIVL